jgi:hypothetical protein
MSLWDDGDHYSSRKDLQLAYSPPKSDLPGAAVALSLIVCWVSWLLLLLLRLLALHLQIGSSAVVYLAYAPAGV